LPEYRSTVCGLSVNCRWSIGQLSYNIKSLDCQCQLYNLYAICLDHVRKFSCYQARHPREILQSPSVPVVCTEACVCSRYAETSIHSRRWLRGTRYALSSIEFNWFLTRFCAIDYAGFIQNILSINMSTDTWPIYRSRCVSQHTSTDISVKCRSRYWPIIMSVDMLTDTSRSTHRPRVSRYVDQHISRASLDMSTKSRLICRSICRPTYCIGQGVHKLHMILFI